MPVVPNVISHWYHLIEGLQTSSKDFYAAVEQGIGQRQLPDVRLSRIDYKEGGMFSAKREYLRIQRKEYIFDICAAPFGTGFFVSWWLGEAQGCLEILAEIPFLNIVIRPGTYYKIDTALMFQESVHLAVMEVVDAVTTAKGIRALSEAERKPILHQFFQR